MAACSIYSEDKSEARQRCAACMTALSPTCSLPGRKRHVSQRRHILLSAKEKLRPVSGAIQTEHITACHHRYTALAAYAEWADTLGCGQYPLEPCRNRAGTCAEALLRRRALLHCLRLVLAALGQHREVRLARIRELLLLPAHVPIWMPILLHGPHAMAGSSIGRAPAAFVSSSIQTAGVEGQEHHVNIVGSYQGDSAMLTMAGLSDSSSMSGHGVDMPLHSIAAHASGTPCRAPRMRCSPISAMPS